MSDTGMFERKRSQNNLLTNVYKITNTRVIRNTFIQIFYSIEETESLASSL